MPFNELLKTQRLKKGLIQRELAEKIKATNTSVSNWENGVSQPSASVIELLAQALEVTPFDLLGEFSLQDIQELDNKKPSERSFEEEMALTFSYGILKEANIDINEIADSLQETSRSIKELAASIQGVAWQLLLGDGGKEILLAYDCLNADGKALVIEYVKGILKVPSFLGEPDIGADEEIISGLDDACTGLKGGWL